MTDDETLLDYFAQRGTKLTKEHISVLWSEIKGREAFFNALSVAEFAPSGFREMVLRQTAWVAEWVCEKAPMERLMQMQTVFSNRPGLDPEEDRHASSCNLFLDFWASLRVRDNLEEAKAIWFRIPSWRRRVAATTQCTEIIEFAMEADSEPFTSLSSNPNLTSEQAIRMSFKPLIGELYYVSNNLKRFVTPKMRYQFLKYGDLVEDFFWKEIEGLDPETFGTLEEVWEDSLEDLIFAVKDLQK